MAQRFVHFIWKKNYDMERHGRFETRLEGQDDVFNKGLMFLNLSHHPSPCGARCDRWNAQPDIFASIFWKILRPSVMVIFILNKLY